jgi:hypothetical protein
MLVLYFWLLVAVVALAIPIWDSLLVIFRYVNSVNRDYSNWYSWSKIYYQPHKTVFHPGELPCKNCVDKFPYMYITGVFFGFCDPGFPRL